MKLRTCTLGLLAALVCTSTHADQSAFDPNRFLDLSEDTYVAQLPQTEPVATTAQAALVVQDADPSAGENSSVVDSIIANTVVVGNWLPLLADEGETTVSSASDPSFTPEATGSLPPVDLAIDGLEDK